MKKSTLKTGLFVSIVFLCIIAAIIMFYNHQIEGYKLRDSGMVMRVVAAEDIQPGTLITDNNIKVVQVQDVVDTKGLIYKKTNSYTTDPSTGAMRTTDETGTTISDEKLVKELLSDDLWCVGKVANQRIYAGEFLTNVKLTPAKELYSEGERLYAIPFDSKATGGFNVAVGEYVDIAVIYKTDVDVNNAKTNPTLRKIFESLKENQITDVVLARRLIEDIRDETGTSVVENSATKPGFISFRLTYEEINKLEWAKQCGSLYIGKTKFYETAPYAETFMQGMTLPLIGGTVVE